MSSAALPTEELARRCAEETEKFNRRQASDPQYCFELFRRALAEDRGDAFTLVYQIYERQVLAWVLHHSRFPQTGESAEFFAAAALRTFYFALRGPKFERFPALPQVLAYLKLCVHTAIAQYIRDQRPDALLPLDNAATLADTPDLGMRAAALEIWQHICRLLPDERDRLLAYCAFALDLKPRQIVERYPERWRDERDVSLALYRIRRVLRQDAELCRRAGVDAVS